jgi:hypothetical protein
MTELHDLLHRATDRVETPGLASDALAVARCRRRSRRAGVVASTTVAVVVVGVALAGWMGDATDEPRPAPPVGTIAPTSLDLQDVADLPDADPSVEPLLPARLDVPDLAPHVEDDPVDAAVLSVDDGADVLLLGTDGKWRCVVVDGKTQPAPMLSPRGTRLAVATTDGVVTVDLATGVQSRRPLPTGFAPTEAGTVGMSWLDEQRLLFVDGGGGRVVDVVRDTEEWMADPPPAEDAWRLGTPAVTGPVGWTLRPVTQLADGTGLLQVARGPRGPGRWWLVHWDPATNVVALVSTIAASSWKSTSYARELLAR